MFIKIQDGRKSLFFWCFVVFQIQKSLEIKIIKIMTLPGELIPTKNCINYNTLNSANVIKLPPLQKLALVIVTGDIKDY